MLQLDDALVESLHERGFEVAIETNGTLPAAKGLDWICVSPKAGTQIVQRSGNELKLVWPQAGIDPAEIESWAELDTSAENRSAMSYDVRSPGGAAAGTSDAGAVESIRTMPATSSG